MTRLFVALALASVSLIASAADKPLPVTVTNPVLPVEVSNAQPIPVKVQEDSARTPYSVDVFEVDCSNSSCFLDLPPVPAGKTLVIQHLSAFLRPSNSATIFEFAELAASSTEEDTRTRFMFPLARIGLAGSSVTADTWSVNAPLLAFVTAGQFASVTFTTRLGGANSVTFAQATISGYLIDAP